MRSLILKTILGLVAIPSFAAEVPQTFFAEATDVRSSFFVENLSTGKSCVGSWFSRTGYAILPLSCLRHKEGGYPEEKSQLSYISVPELGLESPSLILRGPGSIYFSLKDILSLDEEKLFEFQGSGKFAGDGNYAILKFALSEDQMKAISCSQISLQKLQLKEDVWVLSTKAPSRFHHMRVGGIFDMKSSIWSFAYYKNLYNSYLKSRHGKMIPYLFPTPYSAIVKNLSASKPMSGATAYSSEGLSHGMIVYIQNSRDYYKTISFGDIFEKISERISPELLDEIYSCTGVL